MNPTDRYIRLAEQWGQSLEDGDADSANLLFDLIQDEFQQLCNTNHERELFNRVDTLGDAARFFIASHLKDRDPSEARRLYRELTSSSQQFIGLSAKHALNEMAS